uniref:Laminin G domain-containing protein n=1 Tax=Setaria digitata TaxID=48799 RepID=A0A915Q534_9BILA
MALYIATKTSLNIESSCEDHSVLCEQLCIALSSDTYKCWCWDGHVLLGDGIGCVANESRINIQFSTHATGHLTKFPLRPIHFTGHNFVQFPAPENAYLETSIVIEFRTEDYNEGILLYAGEYEGNDFISIIFKDGDIVFRFNCGEGTLEETYAGPFQKNIWHRLTAKRVFCDRSQIIVDSKNALSDEIQLLNNYKGITIETGICIGGAPDRVRNLHHQASTVKKFRGCVRYIVVNNVILYDISSRINHAVIPIREYYSFPEQFFKI